jgi:WD40 repeat protein
MAAVSPDGKYIAEVSSDGNQLSMGSLTGQAAVKPVSGPGSDITSISWDRQDDLWLTQDGNVWMVPQGGKAASLSLSYQVTALAVAPDGVRIALIVQDESGNQIQLASINPNGSQAGQPPAHGTEAATPTMTLQPAPLGPGITDATALTWYDADNLIVLSPSGSSDVLQVVSVDGRASSQNLAPPPTQQGVTVDSIAAGNGSNVVVAGLSNGQLEVSAGFEGPWQLVPGFGGYAPIYVIPSAPTGS